MIPSESRLLKNHNRKNFMSLREENILLRNQLLMKVRQLNKVLEPGFNFGIVKKDNRKDFFAALVLNKIYALNISIKNSILCNDVFLSVYLYRYIYELYAKVFYIFSGFPKEESYRLTEFFENKNWRIGHTIRKIDSKFIPSELKKSHQKRYAIMSRIVHPNVDSLNLNANRTNDSQFEFLVPNIELSIWHIIEIIKLFLSKKLLNLNKSIDKIKIGLL